MLGAEYIRNLGKFWKSWNISEILKYFGIFWDILEYFEIFWNIFEFFEYFRVFCKSWNILEADSGIRFGRCQENVKNARPCSVACPCGARCGVLWCLCFWGVGWRLRCAGGRACGSAARSWRCWRWGVSARSAVLVAGFVAGFVAVRSWAGGPSTEQQRTRPSTLFVTDRTMISLSYSCWLVGWW